MKRQIQLIALTSILITSKLKELSTMPVLQLWWPWSKSRKRRTRKPGKNLAVGRMRPTPFEAIKQLYKQLVNRMRKSRGWMEAIWKLMFTRKRFRGRATWGRREMSWTYRMVASSPGWLACKSWAQLAANSIPARMKKMAMMLGAVGVWVRLLRSSYHSKMRLSPSLLKVPVQNRTQSRNKSRILTWKIKLNYRTPMTRHSAWMTLESNVS